jgi:predicted ATPase/DNA-binding winged helix-turn-helix (wHTH) protein
MTSMRYLFAGFELNTETCQLSGPHGEIHVEPQVFDVLRYLIVNRQRVVTKDEILDEVWESRFVSESALTSRVKAARSAIGDSGQRQKFIRTAHGRGYQFVADVTEQLGSTAVEPGPTERKNRSLPTVANEFRGRERELVELTELLSREHLITVIGPGGTGKTRMSVEVARALPAEQPVVFVDLAAVRDADALGQALTAAIGIESGIEDDVVAACAAFLRARPTLLIVDNCEHVAAAAVELVARVLAAAPKTLVLATSRVPLGHPEETLYRLSPLPVLLFTAGLTVESAQQNAAIALFCDRAIKVQQDFELNDASLADVTTLCRSLDGLPLALELAAGRMGAFSVSDLVNRLDRRLDLLGDQRGGADARHRTLRMTLNWSYDLLPEACRRLFRFLSVFPAGLSLDGVEWLGERIDLHDDPLLALNGLVESSLVVRAESPSDTRYVLLETMRAFGIDLLTASDERAMADGLVADWAIDLTGSMPKVRDVAATVEWDDRIRREIPNLREGRIQLRNTNRCSGLVQISVDLSEWGRVRDLSELWQWCDELQDLTELSSADAARVGSLRSLAAVRRGRIEESIKLATVALKTAEDDWARATALGSLGVALLFSGRFEEAAEICEQRVAIDGFIVESGNAALCRAYAGGGRAERAVADQIRIHAAQTGDAVSIAWADYTTGEIAALNGDPDGIEFLTDAVDLAQLIGTGFIVGVAGLTLSTLVAAAGDTAEAARRYRDLIDHWLRSGTWTQQWTTMRNAAELLAADDPGLALTIMRVAQTDPYAPDLTGAAAAKAEAFTDSLVARLGKEVDGAGDVGTHIDRSELAEKTRTALARLM